MYLTSFGFSEVKNNFGLSLLSVCLFLIPIKKAVNGEKLVMLHSDYHDTASSLCDCIVVSLCTDNIMHKYKEVSANMVIS